MIAWIFLRVRRGDGRVLGRDEGCECAWKLKEHAVCRTLLAAPRTLTLKQRVDLDGHSTSCSLPW